MPMVNQVIFFVSYTFVRIFLFPLGMWYQARNLYLMFDRISFARKVSSILALLLYISMYTLFVIWYKLILKGVFKIISGAPPKKPKASTVK